MTTGPTIFGQNILSLSFILLMEISGVLWENIMDSENVVKKFTVCGGEQRLLLSKEKRGNI